MNMKPFRGAGGGACEEGGPEGTKERDGSGGSAARAMLKTSVSLEF